MTDNKITRTSLKGMTDEEKKQRKRDKQREYMAKRRAEDPVFAENQRRMVRDRTTLLRATDNDFVEKHKQQCLINNQKVKAKLNDMRERIKCMDSFILLENTA